MKKHVIIIVFIIFLTPVMLAILLNSRWLDWTPEAARSHGELITPVVPLEAFELLDSQGNPVRDSDLHERWHLVHVQPGECADECLQQLYWLRQIRTSQDRHQPDVGLILLTATTLPETRIEQILELAPDFLVLHGAAGSTLLPRFPEPDTPASVYILDPQANIMMRYAHDADPTGIRKDLRRLLTWTKQ